MARASKQMSAAQIEAPSAGINTEELDQAGAAMAENATRIAVIDREYGIDMPYNLDLYIARIKRNASEAASRLIEIGLMLIQIREREPRGTFHDAVTEIGFGIRFAQRSMQAAAKLHDRPQITALGMSKALELLSEDDDTLAELEDGGTVAGLTLDEIDTMTVRELKATLRAERKEREEEQAVNDEIIRSKDERINKLVRDKRKGNQAAEFRQQIEELLRDADAAVVDATSHIAMLRNTVAQVQDAYANEGAQIDEDVQSRLDANLAWCNEQLHGLADDLGE